MTIRFTTVCTMDLERRLNVTALAERLLFDGDDRSGGSLVLLSVLGPHSAVRAILAAASSRRELRVPAWPGARFYGGDGGRMITHSLSREVTHGVWLARDVLLSNEPGPVVILDPTPERVFARLNHVHAIPALPPWASWLYDELGRKNRLTRLSGFGATACRVSATETELDELIASGVRRGDIRL